MLRLLDENIPVLFDQVIRRTKKSASQLARIAVYNEMSVHIEGALPTRLISTRRPREDEERFQFRVNNYEPITKGPMQESIDSLFRIFNDNGYDIQCSEGTMEYLSEPRFNGMAFMPWIQSRVMTQMLLDPNCIIAVIPYGPGLTNETAQVDTRFDIVSSMNLEEVGDNYVLYLSQELSLVEINKRQQLEGKVYYLLTDTAYWRAEQYGKKHENLYRIALMYPHKMGYAPFCTMGGIWNEGRGVYDSFFASFLAFANEAIRQYSDWQGTMVTSAYPHKVVSRIDCPNKACSQGRLQDGAECKTCHGQGYVPNSSPYGVFIRPEINTALGDVPDPRPPIEFVSPPTDIIALQQKSWVDLLSAAKEALHLSKANPGESADSRRLDQEREYSMILKISNNLFDNIVSKLVAAVEGLRNINVLRKPHVVKPKEFGLRSEVDLILELKTFKDMQAPASMIEEIMLALLKTRYNTNESVYLEQKFLMWFDTLYPYSIEEKMAMLSISAITEYEFFRSMHAENALETLLLAGMPPPKESDYAKLFKKLEDAILILWDADRRHERSEIASAEAGQSILATATPVGRNLVHTLGKNATVRPQLRHTPALQNTSSSGGL